MELKQLAEFSFAARRSAGPLRNNASLRTFNQNLLELSQTPGSLPVVAYLRGAVAGWLCLITHIPPMIFIEQWHPIVAPGSSEAETAGRLLAAAKRYTRRAQRQRLEVYIPVTEDDKPRYEAQRIWYEVAGLREARQEAGMVFDLAKQVLPSVRLPPQFSIRPLSEVSNDELYGPFCETFANSDDREWLDETEDERRATFNYWFARSRPFLSKASLALMRDGRFAGVCVVRPWSARAVVGPFGIHPAFRGHGLGKALLVCSMQLVKEAGFDTVNLEVDIANHRAYVLYHGLGFQQTYLGITHCWKPPEVKGSKIRQKTVGHQ